MPEALQAIALDAASRCPSSSSASERYGDTFTLRLRHSAPGSCSADPEDVKRVFSAGTDDLGVGVPNLALRPVLGRALGDAAARSPSTWPAAS